MDNSNKPNIRAYCGQSGSGKGVSVRAFLREYLEGRAAPRLLIWDPLGEYREFVTTTVSDPARLAELMTAPSFRLAFYPGPDASKFAAPFEKICRLAFAAGNLLFLPEELGDVTTASWAPPAWRRCSKQGRHRGLWIVAPFQRPAQIDKEFLGNCTYIRCFSLRYPNDRKVLSDVMDVPLEDIKALATIELKGGDTEINYIERDFRLQKTTKSSIRIGGKK